MANILYFITKIGIMGSIVGVFRLLIKAIFRRPLLLLEIAMDTLD
jgi:hypothetical protein